MRSKNHPSERDLRSSRPVSEGDELEQWEVEQEAAKVLETLRKEITPTRVGLAGAVVFLFIGLMFSGYYWALPRDAVSLETHYMQRGGHLMMSEIHNDGSRAITDVEIRVEFQSLDGMRLDHMDISIDKISPHASVLGDELEMMVVGHTVWDEYRIQATLSWTDYSGTERSEKWEHIVGTWSQEIFIDKADRHTWPLN